MAEVGSSSGGSTRPASIHAASISRTRRPDRRSRSHSRIRHRGGSGRPSSTSSGTTTPRRPARTAPGADSKRERPLGAAARRGRTGEWVDPRRHRQRESPPRPHFEGSGETVRRRLGPPRSAGRTRCAAGEGLSAGPADGVLPFPSPGEGLGSGPAPPRLKVDRGGAAAGRSRGNEKCTEPVATSSGYPTDPRRSDCHSESHQPQTLRTRCIGDSMDRTPGGQGIR